MAGLSRKFVGTVSIEVAEATALLNGLHLAIESGFSRLLVESDALNIINYLSLPDPPLSEVGLIISDILICLLESMLSFLLFLGWLILLPTLWLDLVFLFRMFVFG
ncbi:hypothetical protein ACOSQ3_033633 [Xanthoceras sorbifolium]